MEPVTNPGSGASFVKMPGPDYRPCVGMAVFNRSGMVFVGRRRGGEELLEHGYEWQMPQGGIDKEEAPIDAALRELHEETNISSVAHLAELSGWLCYDLPPEVAGKAWKGRYRGQAQKWFAFRFTGNEDEIDIASPGGHAPEFDDWRWERLNRTPSLIVPFKRQVYETVAAEFTGLSS